MIGRVSLPLPRGRLPSLVAVVLFGVPLASAAGPGEILRRAEEVRSPSLDYAVDFSISVADDYTPGQTRTASYTMIAAGKARAIILMLGPDPFFGGTLLSRDREFWLLLPLASRAIQLSSEALSAATSRAESWPAPIFPKATMRGSTARSPSMESRASGSSLRPARRTRRFPGFARSSRKGRSVP
jgi:hypothetical protein